MILLKIKEVIEKTGLTDRAVRLYIEHGLVTPENQKSYTGRNNYNFTQADIDCLEKIAMLRKADFSLEQIKILKLGGESAREVLLEYLTAKQESVVMGQKIVEALKGFSAQESVTMESVCAKIKESIENTPLPETDEKETIGERIEKWLMRIPAIILLAIWSLFGIGVLIFYHRDFPFPRFYAHPAYYIGVIYVLIPIILAITVLLLYRKRLFHSKGHKIHRWIAGAALVLALLIVIQPLGAASVFLIPPIYSETDNPKNYLTMGNSVKMFGDDIYKLFPANIPRSAIEKDSNWYPPNKFLDNTKYYYYFEEVIDPSFHVYAEWVLPKKEFAEELTRIHNYYPEGANQQTRWGEWTCLSFTDDTLDFNEAEDLDYYYYLIFAYNEKTGGVRYIASYSMDCEIDDDPYFLLLQWE